MKEYRNLLAAGTLIGDKVVNQQNEAIGKIEELMISVKDGQVSYAVMSFGGFLGFGNKFWLIMDSGVLPKSSNSLRIHAKLGVTGLLRHGNQHSKFN